MFLHSSFLLAYSKNIDSRLFQLKKPLDDSGHFKFDLDDT